MAKPIYTTQQVIGQLDSGHQWSGSQITYGFLQSAPAWDVGYEGDGFSAFTAYQIADTRNIVSLWDDLISPSFAEQSTNQQYANIKLGNTTSYISYAHAYYPGSYWWAGEVWLNAPTYNGLYTPDPGDYYHMTIVHEMGHALGLSHPGNYNGGSPTYTNDAEYAQDTHQWTVMSYFDASYTGADWNGGSGWHYAQTPMVHDILTIQSIYGADTTTRSGNTTYGFNANAGNPLYDFSQNTSPVLSIYDAGGTDTLDLSGFSQRAIINLEPGTYSSVGGTTSSMTYNLGIAYNTWIENAIGGSGYDTIYGNALANVLAGNGGDDHLYGYGGNDTLSGGTGTDWAHFTLSFASYSYQLAESAIQVIGDYVDTILNDIEWFSFADMTASYGDIVAQLSPTTYSDGDDIIELPANGGNVAMLGGDDWVSYLGGYATIDGGSGSDTVYFYGFGSAVWVNLAYPGAEVWTRYTTHVNSGTWHAIADLANVENIIGSAYSDKITGDGGDNTIRYTGGYDIVDGGGGTDKIDFTGFGAAVWVNLSYAGLEAWTRYTSHVNSGTWYAIGDLANIENITGTAFDDKLYGNDQANQIDGGAGNDILTGYGGDDHLDGGAGVDTAAYSNAIGTYGFTRDGSDLLITSSAEGTDTVSNTVEYLQFADMTITRSDLISALTPPVFTENSDSVTLPVFGGNVAMLGGDDWVSYLGGYATIDGGSGSDTVYFYGFGSAVWVNLTYPGAEVWTRYTTHVNSGTWHAIADLANVENIIGTAYSDKIFGDGGDNTIRYTGGYDIVDGGGGTDKIDFTGFGAAVWVNLSYAGPEAWTRYTSHVNSGTWYAIGDLSNIENITGTAFDDKLSGNDQANQIDGGAGNDVLTGYGGDDLFVFEDTGSADVITDFAAGAGTDDVIDISAFGFSSFADVLAIAEDGPDVVLHLDLDDSVTLLGVQLAALNAGDFILS